MSKNENPGGPGTPLPRSVPPSSPDPRPGLGAAAHRRPPPAPDSGYSPPAHTKTRPPAATRGHRDRWASGPAGLSPGLRRRRARASRVGTGSQVSAAPTPRGASGGPQNPALGPTPAPRPPGLRRRERRCSAGAPPAGPPRALGPGARDPPATPPGRATRAPPTAARTRGARGPGRGSRGAGAHTRRDRGGRPRVRAPRGTPARRTWLAPARGHGRGPGGALGPGVPALRGAGARGSPCERASGGVTCAARRRDVGGGPAPAARLRAFSRLRLPPPPPAGAARALRGGWAARARVRVHVRVRAGRGQRRKSLVPRSRGARALGEGPEVCAYLERSRRCATCQCARTLGEGEAVCTCWCVCAHSERDRRCARTWRRAGSVLVLPGEGPGVCRGAEGGKCVCTDVCKGERRPGVCMCT